MSQFTKDVYDRKENYVRNLMNQNAEVESLTEEQHNALATVASIRHRMHSDLESYFYSEGSADWDVFDDINNTLAEAGLPPVSFTYDISDIPTDNDYYENVWDEFPSDQYEDFHDWIENSGIYDEFYRIMEQLNSDIEAYLGVVDQQHGTQYAPTGRARLDRSFH